MARIHRSDFGKVLVIMNFDQVPVVKAGTLQIFIIGRKAQRLDQMQLNARSGTETRNISRIARDFRFYQYNMQWFSHLV